MTGTRHCILEMGLTPRLNLWHPLTRETIGQLPISSPRHWRSFCRCRLTHQKTPSAGRSSARMLRPGWRDVSQVLQLRIKSGISSAILIFARRTEAIGSDSTKQLQIMLQDFDVVIDHSSPGLVTGIDSLLVVHVAEHRLGGLLQEERVVRPVQFPHPPYNRGALLWRQFGQLFNDVGHVHRTKLTLRQCSGKVGFHPIFPQD